MLILGGLIHNILLETIHPYNNNPYISIVHLDSRSFATDLLYFYCFIYEKSFSSTHASCGSIFL